MSIGAPEKNAGAMGIGAPEKKEGRNEFRTSSGQVAAKGRKSLEKTDSDDLGSCMCFV